MKTFRKWMAAFLVLMICTGCGIAAAEEKSGTIDLPMAGIRIDVPAVFGETKGVIGTDGAMELASGSNIYYAYLYYCATGREEFDQLFAEDPGMLSSRVEVICYVFAIGNSLDFSTMVSLTGIPLAAENALQIGQAGTYTFYLYMQENPEFAASVGGEYGAEYTALCSMEEQIAAGLECYEPVNEYTASLGGTVIRFEGTDLNGNPVSSEKLFAQHEITMVNIWATWCGPCVSELKDLQALHLRFLEKDCGIVGLMTDRNTEEAQRLVRENGMTYPVVLAPDKFDSIVPFSAIPTTFFVDRNGTYLGPKIVGVQTAQYEQTMESLLAERNQKNQ